MFLHLSRWNWEDPTVEVGRWHDQNIDDLTANQEHQYDGEKDHFIQQQISIKTQYNHICPRQIRNYQYNKGMGL